MTRVSGTTAIRSLPLALVGMIVAALVVVACGTTTPNGSGSSSPVASLPAPSGSSPAPGASQPTPTASEAAESPPGLPSGVAVDPGLLEVLPAEIGGIALEPDPATAEQIASNIPLAKSALSIAVALAVAPGSSGSEELAIVSVVRLRPDVFDEAFFQEWRDTYDTAACEVADGVESSVQTQIGGRTAYVGTCVGGAQTYHVYLPDQGFLVSVTSTGQGRFGELILAGLAQ